jgi:hypothetical protein
MEGLEAGKIDFPVGEIFMECFSRLEHVGWRNLWEMCDFEDDFYEISE